MSRDRGIAIAMLAEAFSVKDLTQAKVRLYEQALQHVPVSVLEPMVQRAIQTRQWFPKVAELLQDAEYARLALVRSRAFEPCAACSQQGWVEREMGGVKRLTRCQCWLAHQESLKQLGVGSEPLALPPAEK